MMKSKDSPHRRHVDLPLVRTSPGPLGLLPLAFLIQFSAIWIWQYCPLSESLNRELPGAICSLVLPRLLLDMAYRPEPWSEFLSAILCLTLSDGMPEDVRTSHPPRASGLAKLQDHRGWSFRCAMFVIGVSWLQK